MENYEGNINILFIGKSMDSKNINIMKRRKTRVVRIGEVKIGGGHPISIQSMTKTDTRDAAATLKQIFTLADKGCQIIRIAVPDDAAAESLFNIVPKSPIPVVSDIHFDYKLALKSIKAGVHALRLNPGNIKEPKRVREVVASAKAKGIPIRIGVNSGSLPKDLYEKIHNGIISTPEAMVEAAGRHLEILEDLNFYDTKISLKASDVPITIAAYRLMAKACDYPFHSGITESGTIKGGIIKSSVGLGILISEGLADTIRVSLTGDPVEEIKAGRKILESLNEIEKNAELVSCPTCGRISINLPVIAEKIEDMIEGIKVPVKIAVMGCEVNGPGEAKEADLGVAGGKGVGIIFKKGKIIKKVPEKDILKTMKEEINILLEENKNL